MVNNIIEHAFWVAAVDCMTRQAGEVCRLIIMGGQIKQ
ncbi:hypothetical protein QF010_004147 [Pseudomonas silensiensis]